MTVTRCGWCEKDDLYRDYHDNQWGVPVHDDRLLFEMLILEGAQAGLSWYTILKRRAGYREAFQGFDLHKMLAFSPQQIEDLAQDPRIIRHRGKIESAFAGARAFLKIQEEFGSFDTYLWQFVGGKPIVNSWKTLSDIPSETELSRALSKDLKKRGFTFVGPSICYAYMQAVGLVNDHLISCFRYEPCRLLACILHPTTLKE